MNISPKNVQCSLFNVHCSIVIYGAQAQLLTTGRGLQILEENLHGYLGLRPSPFNFFERNLEHFTPDMVSEPPVTLELRFGEPLVGCRLMRKLRVKFPILE